MYICVQALKLFEKRIRNETAFYPRVTEFFQNQSFGNDAATTGRFGSVAATLQTGVWGSISVSPTASAILNLPIIQSLRNISRLGFSNLYYPSANFRVFDHVLGSYHVLEQIISSRGERSHFPVDSAFVPQAYAQLLATHACLLTDIAAPPFGLDMSEVLLDNEKEFTIEIASIDRDAFFAIFQGAVRSTLGEWACSYATKLRILSAAMVLSEEFRTYYDRLIREFAPHQERDAIYHLASAMLGLPTEDGELWLRDALFGPLGAKNLDHLAQCAAAGSYSLPVDVRRVIASLSLLSVRSSDITDTPEVDKFADSRGMVRIMAHSTADPVLWRDVQGAYNQRFRRINTQPTLTYINIRFRQMIESFVLDTKKRTTKSDYFDLIGKLEQSLLAEISDADEGRAAYVAHQLRYRQLGRRYCSLTPQSLIFPRPPFLDVRSKGYAELKSRVRSNLFLDLKSKLTDRQWRRDLEAALILEASEIHQRLKVKHPSIIDGWHLVDRPQESSIISTTLVAEPQRSGVGRAFTGETLDDLRCEPVFEPSKVSDPTAAGDAVNFYTSERWREIMYIALERTLYERFTRTDKIEAANLPETFWKYGIDHIEVHQHALLEEEFVSPSSGLDRMRMEALKGALSDDKYYDTMPALVRPSSRYRSELRRLSEKFKAFDGEASFRITVDHVEDFVSQFKPDLRHDLIVLLEQIKMIERSDLSNFVIREARNLLSKGQYKRVHLIPFSISSGSRMKANLGDFNIKHVKLYNTVHEWAPHAGMAGECIMFFDDNLISGTQGRAQLAAWQGLDDRAKDDRIDPKRLAPDQIAMLKKLPTYFAFYVADTDGAKRLESDLRDAKFLSLKSTPVLKAYAASNFCGRRICTFELKDFLRDIGEQLYSRKKQLDGETEEVAKAKAENRALGFDNAEGLFCFPHNAPTSLYTAFWCPGMVTYKGSSRMNAWTPLFLRNNSLDQVVVG